jgi:predicted XRE-type DNA-binding protein
LDNLGECVVLLDIEVSTAETEVCDCKKKKNNFFIKRAIITKKKEVISTNQLKKFTVSALW